MMVLLMGMIKSSRMAVLVGMLVGVSVSLTWATACGQASGSSQATSAEQQGGLVVASESGVVQDESGGEEFAVIKIELTRDQWLSVFESQRDRLFRAEDQERIAPAFSKLQQRMSLGSAPLPVVEQVQEALLKSYDRNRDGRYDAQERRALRGYLESLLPMSLGALGEASSEALLIRFDRDEDGRLDAQEREQMQWFLDSLQQSSRASMLGESAEELLQTEPVRTRAEFDAEAVVRRFDVDGDGRLDAQERVEARRYLLGGGAEVGSAGTGAEGEQEDRDLQQP